MEISICVALNLMQCLPSMVPDHEPTVPSACLCLAATTELEIASRPLGLLKDHSALIKITVELQGQYPLMSDSVCVRLWNAVGMKQAGKPSWFYSSRLTIYLEEPL